MENAKIFSGMHLRHIFQINSRTGNIMFDVRRRHCFSLCMKFNSSTICRRVLVFILSCEGELCRGSFHTAINNYFHVVLCRCLIPCSIKCLQTVTNVLHSFPEHVSTYLNHLITSSKPKRFNLSSQKTKKDVHVF